MSLLSSGLGGCGTYIDLFYLGKCCCWGGLGQSDLGEVVLICFSMVGYLGRFWIVLG